MAYSSLKAGRIAEIKRAFIDAQVSYNAEARALLLTGINPQFVASLRRFSSDQMQLSGDLNSLNSVERLSDGTVPLKTWLENAVELFAPRTQATIFSQALEELSAVIEGAGEPATRDPGVWAGGVVIPSDPPDQKQLHRDARTRPQEIEIRESAVTRARNDIVNFGFVSENEAAVFLPKNRTLKCNQSYYFWFNIGYELAESIGSAQPLYVENLPTEVNLTVALFAFEQELKITPGEDIGELRIQREAEGNKEDSTTPAPLLVSVKVIRQPTPRIPSLVNAPPDTSQRFLFFPVQTPEQEGSHRLRCNIYCGQVLVQSHLVNARVMHEPVEADQALSAKVDYALSQTLRPAHLAAIQAEPHRLSLMINSNGDGTHSFRFFGADGTERFKDDAHIDGQQIGEFLKEARRALKKISWGNEEEWDPGKKGQYRYAQEKFNAGELARDLAYLARAGWRIYDGFETQLKTGDQDLEKIMAHSGSVQVALKFSPRAVLPAAVIYDYPWIPEKYPDFSKTSFELCPTFAEAIEKAGNADLPLDECACFQGGCYLKSQIEKFQKTTLMDLPPIICPSGFWGYRHELGFPLTLDGTDSETPPVIKYQDKFRVTAGLSMDPELVKRDGHLDNLSSLTQKVVLERGKDYREVMSSLRTMAPHLLYFYCHGGTLADSKQPYLEIGSTDYFLPSTLRAERVSLHDPHPLVFINGCHTTSLDPEVTLDFVSAFVQKAGASGVIGTEITIFEELAVSFAEECLKRFLGSAPWEKGMPIGKAVRGARLELLRRGNPLGLVYIPFAMASLRLQDASQN